MENTSCYEDAAIVLSISVFETWEMVLRVESLSMNLFDFEPGLFETLS